LIHNTIGSTTAIAISGISTGVTGAFRDDGRPRLKPDQQLS